MHVYVDKHQRDHSIQPWWLAVEGDLALFDCSLCVPVTHWACAVIQARSLYKSRANAALT